MAWDLHQLTSWADQLGRAGPTAATATSVAIGKAAEKVYREARASAPVGETGHLRDSIVMRQLGPFAAIVEADADYAPFVEYGTVRTAPQPYMIPAAQGADEDLHRAITAAGLAGLR